MIGFNRTNVELKPWCSISNLCRENCFNRTNVELKRCMATVAIERHEGRFNRTNVELKHVTMQNDQNRARLF